MTDRTGTDPVPLVAGLAELSQPPPATLLRQLGESLGVGDTYVLVEGRAGAVWVAYNDRGVNLLTLASDETDERHFLSAYTVRYGHRPLRRAAVPPPQLASALRRSGEDQEDHEGDGFHGRSSPKTDPGVLVSVAASRNPEGPDRTHGRGTLGRAVALPPLAPRRYRGRGLKGRDEPWPTSSS